MTQTIEPGSGSAADSPAARATAWLTGFEDALRARDVDRAAGMFAATSFWRDLVSFTWNITTVEDPAGVADLLRSTLEGTDPSGFPFEEEPTEADGVITGVVHVRDRGRARPRAAAADRRGRTEAWTLLTTLTELKGYEEARGDARPKGVEHGAQQGPDQLAGTPRAGGRRSSASRPALRADRRRRPGRDRAGRAAAPARGAVAHRRQALAPRRPVAQPVQVAVPARPGLVRPPAVPQVPRQLAGVRAQGQDRRLARVLHQGDGAHLLAEHGGRRARRTDEAAGEWTVEVERDGEP